MNRKTILSVGLCLAFALVVGHARPALPCSMFTAHDEETVWVGNNEDWYGDYPNLIWFIPSQDGLYGYAAWGWEENHFSQGGMNDQGLFWDGFATAEHSIADDDGTIPFTLTTLEEVMQVSATVDEAITNLRQYQLSGVISRAQFMFVDRNGDSAIFEGDVVNEPISPVYQICTNFLPSRKELGGWPCWRYDTLVDMMESGLELSLRYFAAMADAVHQGTVGSGVYTRYTNIAELKSGQLYLFYDLDYQNYIHFDLAQELALGPHEYLLTDLVRTEEMGSADGVGCSVYYECRSGHCADGVCCDSVCNGICRSCNQTGMEGLCTDLTDGTSCADPDPCNGDETCQQGSCSPAEPITCDDGVACTDNTCVRLEGCSYTPADNLCDDGLSCTEDVCDTVDGCLNEPLPDGTACDTDGECQSAVCQDTDEDAGGCGCGSVASPLSGGLLALLLLGLYWRQPPGPGKQE